MTRVEHHTRRAGIAALCAVLLFAGAVPSAVAQYDQYGRYIGDSGAGEGDVTVPPPSTDGSLPPGLAVATRYPESDVPRIHPRSTWESFEYSGGTWKPTDILRPLLRWYPQIENLPPDYFAVERIVVHDQGCLQPEACTANAERYPIQTIQGIFRAHAVTRGWGDIGYNYIIDRQGRIFEGRYGGNGVRAAHTYVDSRCENLNVGTAGILLLGDLRAGPMTQAQSESLARLAGWIAATNGFDVTETATTVTWRNPRGADGTCDVSSGGYTGTLTAPRLVSHGDVEPGNSDFFTLATERAAAGSLRTKYLTYAYRADTDAKTFTIRDGVAHETTSATTVAVIDRTQLERFPSATIASLPDGSLVKSRTRERVFVIEQGKRRAVPTADLFVSRGYQWDAIKEVSDRELALWKLGDPLPYPNQTLVKGSRAEVYAFDNGKLRHITSAALFESLKYAWSSIKKLFDSDLEQYPKGDPLLFPDGTLVKSRSSPRVYRIDHGAKRPVLSAALFTALGLRWTDVKTLEPNELSLYPDASPLPWPDGTILRADGQEKVYLMQQGYRRWIQNEATFSALGFQWNQVRVVSPDELHAAQEAQPIGSVADRNAEPQPLIKNQQPTTDNSQPTTNGQQQTANDRPTIPSGQEPIIRVGLATIGSVNHAGSAVTISNSGGATVKKNGAVVATLVSDQQYTFTPAAREVWRIEPSGNGIATIHTYTDMGWQSNDNRFRGTIEAQASADGALWLINELPLEQYMRGIAETINGDPPEYAKAFSIAARTYAYSYILKGGKRPAEPFTLRRTSADQLYKGYNYELRARDPVAASTATRGMVAMFNGKPIVAAYSSGAPGPTKSACEAISTVYCNNADYAYLAGGIDDPPGTMYKVGAACGVNGNHCAGMDAAGGRRMADLGATAQQILTTYYPGITIVTQW